MVIQTPMSCARVEPVVAPNVIERSGYRITYEPAELFVVDPDTLAASYTFHARPLVYGVTGVRSYFAAVGKALTATAADRPATPDDPLVLGCEFDPLIPWRECVQPPP